MTKGNYKVLTHGLSLTFTHEVSGKRDVWINFTAENGNAASLSIAAMAESKSPVIGNALREWASDRLNEYIVDASNANV